MLSLQCSALTHAAIPRLRSPGEEGTHSPPQADTTAITHFMDLPLQFRVHVLGLEEVLPGRAQVFLQMCNVEREGCKVLLLQALLL